MSSFIGIVNGEKELMNKIGSIAENVSPVIQSDFCTIFAEAKSDCLHYSEKSEQNWIVSGIGIRPHPNTSIISHTDWERLFTNQYDDIDKLNGHFVGVIVEEQTLRLVTDQVGMRSMFLLQIGESFIFSTRIDWLLPFSNRKIDWKIFGENWLSINSFTGDLFIPDIQRIHSSAGCRIDRNGLNHHPKKWSPEPVDIDLDSYLIDLSRSVYQLNNQLSLGLSGGLDSRLLLSILAVDPNLKFDLYTFSGLDHPDEEIAKHLGEIVQKPHRFQNYPLESFALNDLANHSIRTFMNSSIHDSLANQLYQKLDEKKLVSIDGGIGEIGRRRYLRSIELRAKNAVNTKDSALLAPFFYSMKADIFNRDITELMKIGFKYGLENTLHSMPEISNKSVGNWLDLFSVRTRVLNLAGLNQEQVDRTHFHIMPFVQPDFLNAILSLPERERLNAKWYRRLIKQNLKSSTKLPLVKGDDVYPFWMADVSSQVWIKLKKRFLKTYQNPLLIDVLLSNESQIRDVLSTNSHHQIDVYDSEKVTHLIQSFYDDNNYHLASSINWLLTFELFRNKLAHEFI